jgi:ABC-type branched-subunit amino acid transport system substrate-binding protein
MKNKGLKKGDTVGLLYGVGAFGDDAKAGMAYIAKSRGLNPVYSQVAGTDTDMSGAMLSFKQAGAKVAVLIALAPQDNNAIAAADAINYQPTFVAGSFLVSALNTSIAPTLKSSRFYEIGNGGGPSTAPLSSTDPLVAHAAATYQQFFHKPLTDSSVIYGYAQGYIYKTAMKTVCGAGTKDPKNPKKKIYKPLTRAGLTTAFTSMKNVDMGGLLPTLDFTLTQHALPPTLAVYLSQVDTSVNGSLKAVTKYFQAPDAATFKEAS